MFRSFRVNVKAVLFISQVNNVCEYYFSVDRIQFYFNRVYIYTGLSYQCKYLVFEMSPIIIYICIFIYLLFIQIVAKGMISRGNGGAIVNISSQASQAALKDHTVYCMYIS